MIIPLEFFEYSRLLGLCKCFANKFKIIEQKMFLNNHGINKEKGKIIRVSLFPSLK